MSSPIFSPNVRVGQPESPRYRSPTLPVEARLVSNSLGRGGREEGGGRGEGRGGGRGKEGGEGGGRTG